jgi:hypothetical protein
MALDGRKWLCGWESGSGRVGQHWEGFGCFLANERAIWPAVQVVPVEDRATAEVGSHPLFQPPFQPRPSWKN